MKRRIRILRPLAIPLLVAIALVGVALYARTRELSYRSSIAALESERMTLTASLADVSERLDALNAVDQKVRNDELAGEIAAIEKTYTEAVDAYEELIRTREMTKKTDELDAQFTAILSDLSDRRYASASSKIAKLRTDMKAVADAVAKSMETTTVAATQSNAPPESGYRRQRVASEVGEFTVDIVSADLGSTRVVVDSASDSDCANDCPVLPLGDYVSRNGGYAGINGSYFCPATYPSCAGKTNSYDTLLMNRNKKYINSENNVYSNVPAVIFQGQSVRFVARSLEWGRDTGVDGVLANQPLLVSGGSVVFGGDGDPKKGSKGARSFVASKGNMVYIGVTSNATVAENAYVLKALGMEYALNLDSGGSTALWFSGYKFGPGRNIPNAIVFVRR